MVEHAEYRCLFGMDGLAKPAQIAAIRARADLYVEPQEDVAAASEERRPHMKGRYDGDCQVLRHDAEILHERVCVNTQLML
jgi:hypothetical protein